jgi:FAD/FMN-containing dehydrogenase/Fe-S oxidoreductase
MMTKISGDIQHKLKGLAGKLSGTLHYDDTMRVLYATDASAYREMPTAVAFPKNKEDIKKLVAFARQNKLSLIPRTAGTSLAGQVVGNGIVVDVSRHFNQILEVNPDEKWAWVQPGVVRNELNHALLKHDLFFGPETSTASRAMIGGMVGNNSCGSNSVWYGSARDHTLEIEAILSNGEETTFRNLSGLQLINLIENAEANLGHQIHHDLYQLLKPKETRELLKERFPKPEIPRRNTGYALDLLANSQPFEEKGEDFNLCKLIAGSEGTLCFITAIKIHLNDTPPPFKALICAHFNSVNEALKANVLVMQYNPSASELMDRYVLECTKSNIEQRKNRFFLEGDPGAVLCVEISKNSKEEADLEVQKIINNLQEFELGYAFPVVEGEDINQVWALRKAGLGLLSNIKGDAKPVAVIEDTAVTVEDLPSFIYDFNKILEANDLHCVHYAHAGSGELHLRPILNLKTKEGHEQFKMIATEIAHLVKKYKGSLSGEHGDGRLRGEFIPLMYGEEVYSLFKEVKRIWDPENIFNPGKIVDTPAMNTSLRYEADQETNMFETAFRWDDWDGYLRAVELCNGSGDCRKTEITGGTMCPSYHATRHEKDTTRARANILREYLTRSPKKEAFNKEEVLEVLDLCLSCKGCKNECPSNVDMTKMKAEYYQHYYDHNKPGFRTKLIAGYTGLNELASLAPWGYNLLMTTKLFGPLSRQVIGFAKARSLPKRYNYTFKSFLKKHIKTQDSSLTKPKVYLFVDEFTNFNDPHIGVSAAKVLNKLGYPIGLPAHVESGRTWLSKGFVRKAKEIATRNVEMLKDLITPENPLVGLEPSTILTFRDEYPDLVPDRLLEAAIELGKNAMTFEEFAAREIDLGNITQESFVDTERVLKVHGHCHQKAITGMVPTKKMLSLPVNTSMHLIPSGCCGMAGSFGYEEEHYDISMKVGETVLFPAVRRTTDEEWIVAVGTSCRHQIYDGTKRKALHPVEVWEKLLK